MTAYACNPDTCGTSSDELKTNVANFMQRADDIAAHPLSGTKPTFGFTVQQDPESGQLVPVAFDMQNLPKGDWLPLAVYMRPIIFLEQDAVSFNVLTKRIEREHRLLRGRLKRGRVGLAAWRKHAFSYSGNVGTAPVPMPPGETRIERILVGPPGQSPSGVNLDELSPDYEYADAYLNACAWHSDNQSARAYQSASDFQKLHYEKCAEVRVLTAVDLVLQLRQWITDARTDGHDL